MGYLEQEPALDASRSVHDNIMDGLREKTALLARYGALSEAMAGAGAAAALPLAAAAAALGAARGNGSGSGGGAGCAAGAVESQ